MNILRFHKLVEKLVCKYDKGTLPQRKLFETSIPVLLVLLMLSNWYVLYVADIRKLPQWFIKLAELVYLYVPGAYENVTYSLRLSHVFKYVYTINFIFFVLVLTLTLQFADKSPGLIRNKRIKKGSDVGLLYFSYLFFSIASLVMVSVFFGGFTLEEGKTLFDVPRTAAGDTAIEFKMYETRFGALIYFSPIYGICSPLILGTLLHIFIRIFVSLFRIFVKSLKRHSYK